MVTNPILFLDIDGVLNNARTRVDADDPRSGLDRELLGAVGRLVAQTDARVVISSMWRVVFPLDDLRARLSPELPPALVIGATPDLARATRGQEIAAWLRAYARPVRCAILDDNDAGMFDMAPLRRWLVRTDGDLGFTPLDAVAAEWLLTQGPVCDVRRLGSPRRRPRTRHPVSARVQDRLRHFSVRRKALR